MEHEVRRLNYRTRKKYHLKPEEGWLVSEKSDRGRAVDRPYATGASPSIGSMDEQAEWEERKTGMTLNDIFMASLLDEFDKIALNGDGAMAAAGEPNYPGDLQTTPSGKVGVLSPFSYRAGAPAAGNIGSGMAPPVAGGSLAPAPVPSASSLTPASPGFMGRIQNALNIGGGHAGGLTGLMQPGGMARASKALAGHAGNAMGNVSGLASGVMGALGGKGSPGMNRFVSAGGELLKRPGTAAALGGGALLAGMVGSRLLGGRTKQVVNPQTGEVVQQKPSLLRRLGGAALGAGALGAGLYGASRLMGR